MALGALRIARCQHHAGIVEEHVEPGFLCQEVLGRGPDCAQVGQVGDDTGEAAAAGGEFMFYAVYGGLDLALGSGGDIDGAVLLVE